MTDRKQLSNKRKLISTLVLLGLTSSALAADTSDVTTKVYGSLRLGADYVDAGTDDDAVNGRDYLSRVE